jgi:AcrR family transcriptional regulator
LSLAALAKRLGVRAPSLYVHVAGLDDLYRRLAIRGARRLAATLQRTAVGLSGDDALRAMAEAYRAYAREHPGTYAALQRAPARDDAEAGAAAAEAVDVFVAMLRGYGIEGDDAIHATRIIRAALHGFVSLEAARGFGLPIDVDETFGRLIGVLSQGLARVRPPP